MFSSSVFKLAPRLQANINFNGNQWMHHAGATTQEMPRRRYHNGITTKQNSTTDSPRTRRVLDTNTDDAPCRINHAGATQWMWTHRNHAGETMQETLTKYDHIGCTMQEIIATVAPCRSILHWSNWCVVWLLSSGRWDREWMINNTRSRREDFERMRFNSSFLGHFTIAPGNNHVILCKSIVSSCIIKQRCITTVSNHQLWQNVPINGKSDHINQSAAQSTNQIAPTAAINKKEIKRK